MIAHTAVDQKYPSSHGHPGGELRGDNDARLLDPSLAHVMQDRDKGIARGGKVVNNDEAPLGAIKPPPSSCFFPSPLPSLSLPGMGEEELGHGRLWRTHLVPAADQRKMRATAAVQTEPHRQVHC